jgi:hypothetical protein
MSVYHNCIFAVDLAEPESRNYRSQHQSRALTLSKSKASLGVFNPAPYLLFESYLMFHYDCVLSLYELYGIVVTLRMTFLFILVNPILW